MPCVEPFFFYWSLLNSLLCDIFDDILLFALSQFFSHVYKFLEVHSLRNVLIKLLIPNGIFDTLTQLIELVILNQLISNSFRFKLEIFIEATWSFRLLELLINFLMIYFAITYWRKSFWESLTTFYWTKCMWIANSIPRSPSDSFWDLRLSFKIEGLLAC